MTRLIFQEAGRIQSWQLFRACSFQNWQKKTHLEWPFLGIARSSHNTRIANGKFVRGRKSNEVSDILECSSLAAVDAILGRLKPSERQSTEFVVIAIKAPFERLNVPLPSDAQKRQRLLRVCCHLF